MDLPAEPTGRRHAADPPLDLGKIERWLRTRPAGSPVAVVLGGQANGLSYLRSLGRRRVPTLMLAGHDPGSRYGRTLELPDAVRQPEDWLAILDRVGRSLPTPGVLIPTSDPLVLLVAQHAAELGARFRFVVPEAHVVESIVNKRSQYQHAAAAGVPIPATHFPSSGKELRALAGELAYPCLLKPYESHLSKQAIGAKAIIAQNPEELLAGYDRYAADHRLLVQDLIPGADDCLFGYVAFWDPVGTEHSWITRQKLRQYPRAIGNGSLQQTVDRPEVAEVGRRLIQSYDYRGPVAVEFKWDHRDDSFRLMEINARSGASNQLGVDAGVDFPWLIYTTALETSGRPVAKPPPFRPGVKWIYEELDFRAFLDLRSTDHMTLRGWLASVRGVESWAFWSLRDPRPFLSRAFAYVRGSVRRRLPGRIGGSSAAGVPVDVVTGQ